MPGLPRIVHLVLLLWVLAGGSELLAQQSGRAVGQAARDFERRDGRRPLGDVLGSGRARGFAPGGVPGAFGWASGWAWPFPHGQVLCRPVGVAGHPASAGQAFLAECSSVPLGYYGGVLGSPAGYGPGGLGGYPGGYGGYAPGAYGQRGYGLWAPPPVVLPPEERPHRFYSEFHPNAAGSGVPPLTCDPRPGAPCPPVTPSTALPARAPLPYLPGGSAGGGISSADCAEITARGVTGAVYRGRTSLAVLGVERAEDAALAIEAALARGNTVALLGEHGYPLYLPPAAFLETLESRACRR